MNNTVLLTAAQVADRFNVSIRSLERWRSIGYGPRYRKIGRKVGYATSDVEEWLDGKEYGSTSEYRGGSHSVGLIVSIDRAL